MNVATLTRAARLTATKPGSLALSHLRTPPAGIVAPVSRLSPKVVEGHRDHRSICVVHDHIRHISLRSQPVSNWRFQQFFRLGYCWVGGEIDSSAGRR